MKILGIVVDKNLNFKQHITAICTKLSKSVGLLHQLKHYLQEELMEKLHYLSIQPYINYGIESWHGACQSFTSGVHVRQKKAIRAVFNLNYNAHANESFERSFISKSTKLT